jgi:hypothetical protein
MTHVVTGFPGAKLNIFSCAKLLTRYLFSLSAADECVASTRQFAKGSFGPTRAVVMCEVERGIAAETVPLLALSIIIPTFKRGFLEEGANKRRMSR